MLQLRRTLIRFEIAPLLFVFSSSFANLTESFPSCENELSSAKSSPVFDANVYQDNLSRLQNKPADVRLDWLLTAWNNPTSNSKARLTALAGVGDSFLDSDPLFFEVLSGMKKAKIKESKDATRVHFDRKPKFKILSHVHSRHETVQLIWDTARALIAFRQTGSFWPWRDQLESTFVRFDRNAHLTLQGPAPFARRVLKEQARYEALLTHLKSELQSVDASFQGDLGEIRGPSLLRFREVFGPLTAAAIVAGAEWYFTGAFGEFTTGALACAGLGVTFNYSAFGGACPLDERIRQSWVQTARLRLYWSFSNTLRALTVAIGIQASLALPEFISALSQLQTMVTNTVEIAKEMHQNFTPPSIEQIQSRAQVIAHGMQVQLTREIQELESIPESDRTSAANRTLAVKRQLLRSILTEYGDLRG